MADSDEVPEFLINGKGRKAGYVDPKPHTPDFNGRWDGIRDTGLALNLTCHRLSSPGFLADAELRDPGGLSRKIQIDVARYAPYRLVGRIEAQAAPPWRLWSISITKQALTIELRLCVP